MSVNTPSWGQWVYSRSDVINSRSWYGSNTLGNQSTEAWHAFFSLHSFVESQQEDFSFMVTKLLNWWQGNFLVSLFSWPYPIHGGWLDLATGCSKQPSTVVVILIPLSHKVKHIWHAVWPFIARLKHNLFHCFALSTHRTWTHGMKCL